MKRKALQVLIVLCLSTFISCSQDYKTAEGEAVKVSTQDNEKKEAEPHKYGGWYCPDNLNGFPPVDINSWQNVPVVNGRLATKEETQNGSSLIFIDTEKYPNAKPLDITMPKLASYYSKYSKREELVIVIQAINVDNDSIVGFRYLNGGNGSARLNEVQFLADYEIDKIPDSRFVNHSIQINASQSEIWKVLTEPENAASLQPIFDENNELKADWRESSNVNYHYPKSGTLTASYGDILFGNFYIQNDYGHLQYNEKFLLSENQETKQTELIIVCGPFGEDYELQKDILINWAKKVKALSEVQ